MIRHLIGTAYGNVQNFRKQYVIVVDIDQEEKVAEVKEEVEVALKGESDSQDAYKGQEAHN